jgi:zinc transport system substrate-binding protein
MKMIVMNRYGRPVGVLLASAALLLAAGCGGGADGSAGSSAESGELSIVTAFYPFQFVAEGVAGPHAAVSSLTQPGAEPHDVELTPRQVGSVSSADLVLFQRGFQPAVDEAVDQSQAGELLDTASVVPLAPLATAEDGHEEEHAAEEHPEDDHPDEDHGGLDPHVWLDPTKLATIAGAVAERLSALDSENAAAYAANAAALQRDLNAVDEEYRTGLAGCERSEFITTHTAFGYLADRYGLSQVGISGLSPDAEPSPARVAEVQQEARKHGVTTIFYETLVSPAIAESIANDLGLATDVLDPIEGITEQSRGQDYLAVMRSNLVALQKANGCS